MTKRKSTRATSTNYLSLAAPSTQAWPSEKSLTPGTTGNVVPDYSSVARESKNATINALNVASTSAVNAIKSLDRENTVAAKFGELLPSAIKAAKAGAEYRRLYEKYQNSNKQNYEIFAKQQDKEIEGSLLINSEASKQLQLYANIHQSKNPLEALRALSLDDNATRLDELNFAATSLRTTVHKALFKQEFNIDGKMVSLENATSVEKAKIEGIIDSGFYAWLEDNSDFSEKEIFNHVVYPNRKATQAQLKIDLAEQNQEAIKEITRTQNNDYIKAVKGGDTKALGTILNSKVKALPGENHSSFLFNKLDTLIELVEDGTITISEARSQITNSGPVNVKLENGKFKPISNLADHGPFKTKIQEFNSKLDELDSKQRNDSTKRTQRAKIDFQNEFKPLFRNAQNEEERVELRKKFDKVLLSSDFNWTMLDGEMKNLYNSTITQDQMKKFLAEERGFLRRINSGELVVKDEYKHLTPEMVGRLDELKKRSNYPANHPVFQNTLDQYFTDTVLMKAFQGQNELSLTPGATHNIRQEARFKIGAIYNKYLQDHPDDRDRAMQLALEDFSAYWSNMDEKEQFKLIRTWSYPGVGPEAVSKYVNRIQLKNRGALFNAIKTGDYSKILLYTGIPNERLEAELEQLGVKDINNWQTVLNIGYANAGEIPEVQNNLKEWLKNPRGDLKNKQYWNGLHTAIQKQGTNIPQRELALWRARALGIIKTDKELSEKLVLVRGTTSQQTDAIEKSSNKSTDLCVITEGGANIDEQIYAREIEQPVLDAIDSNLIANPYDYHSTIGKPITIDGEERNLSDLSVFEALEYFGKVDEDQLIGAFRMNESQLREAFAMASTYEDKTFFNAKLDQKTQEKLFQYLMRIKANKQCNTQSIDTTWLRLVPISAEYASLFTDSPNPVSVFNSPSSGFLLPGIIDEQLNTG